MSTTEQPNEVSSVLVGTIQAYLEEFTEARRSLATATIEHRQAKDELVAQTILARVAARRDYDEYVAHRIADGHLKKAPLADAIEEEVARRVQTQTQLLRENERARQADLEDMQATFDIAKAHLNVGLALFSLRVADIGDRVAGNRATTTLRTATEEA